MEKSNSHAKSSPRKTTNRIPATHNPATKIPTTRTSATSSPAKQIPPSKSKAQRIPSRPRPQSQYAFSCPQPRYSQCWPWSQHYGHDTCPWERDAKPSSSPKKRQVRASSDTAANCRMTSSMYATERPSSNNRCIYEGGVFGSSSHTAKRDFFVIHPDWVSEADTVKKLTSHERKSRQIVISRPARRCRSAPPPRHRNPITWQY